MKVRDGDILAPDRIVILNLKVEESVTESNPNEKGFVIKAPKKEKRLYYRFYSFEGLCKEQDYTKVGEMIWEHHDPTTLKPETQQGIVEDKRERVTLKRKIEQKYENRLNAMPNEDNQESKKIKDDDKPNVLYACDYDLEEMVMIVIGTDGEQHCIYQFGRPENPEDPK
jgi:hypothetical protein